MSGMTQLPDHVTHVLGWTLIHFLWQGTAVAALLAVANATICSRRVDLRYGLACTGMVLLVLLPTITAWAIGQTAETGPRPAPPALFADAFGGRSEPLVPLMEKADSDAVNWPISARTVEEYLPWAVHLWMVGAALFLFRMAGGWTHLQSLRRFSRPMGDGQWQRIVWAHGRRSGYARGPTPGVDANRGPQRGRLAASGHPRAHRLVRGHGAATHRGHLAARTRPHPSGRWPRQCATGADGVSVVLPSRRLVGIASHSHRKRVLLR